MRAPHLILADDMDRGPLADIRGGRADGSLYRIRGEPFDGRMFRWRWKAAWLVFTGRADVLAWEGTPTGDDILATRAEAAALLKRVPGIIARAHNAEKHGL